jgi:5'-nucleotidase
VELYDGATRLGEATLTQGAATIAIPARTLAPGTHSLTVTYLGDARHAGNHGTVTVTVATAPTTVSGTDATIQWAKGGSVQVAVSPAAATGTVELWDGTRRVGTAALVGGAARITIPSKALDVGRHTLAVRYLGSATYAASHGTVTVTVTKAKPAMTVAEPRAIRAGQEAAITVEVTADGYTPTGAVLVLLRDGSKHVEVLTHLVGGRATARPRVAKAGSYDVTVIYSGDRRTLPGVETTRLRVR